MKNIRNKLAQGLVYLTLAGAGCVQNQGYTISQNVQRAPFAEDNSRAYYNSIGDKVTQDEAQYIESFRKLPKNEQDKRLNDPLLKDLDFLKRDSKDIATILFLKEVEENLNVAALKGF